jgi:hypothetical protein
MHVVEVWKREAVKNKFVNKSSIEVGDDDLEALMQRPDVSEYISSVNAFIDGGINRPLLGNITLSEVGKTLCAILQQL